MSEEQLNAFLETVKTDTSLQEKLKEASTPEAAVEIAKAAGFSITAEDIQSATVELSDEELKGAAGGRTRTPLQPGTLGGSTPLQPLKPGTLGS